MDSAPMMKLSILLHIAICLYYNVASSYSNGPPIAAWNSRAPSIDYGVEPQRSGVPLYDVTIDVPDDGAREFRGYTVAITPKDPFYNGTLQGFTCQVRDSNSNVGSFDGSLYSRGECCETRMDHTDDDDTVRNFSAIWNAPGLGSEGSVELRLYYITRQGNSLDQSTFYFVPPIASNSKRDCFVYDHVPSHPFPSRFQLTRACSPTTDCILSSIDNGFCMPLALHERQTVLACLESVVTDEPDITCISMAPNDDNGTYPQNSSAPYNVTTNVPAGGATSGNNYTVTITALNTTFRAFMCQVRKDDTSVIVGSFISFDTEKAENVNCSGNPKAAVIHRNASAFVLTTFSATWQASGPVSGDYQLRVYCTIAKDEEIYWMRVSSSTFPLKSQTGPGVNPTSTLAPRPTPAVVPSPAVAPSSAVVPAPTSTPAPTPKSGSSTTVASFGILSLFVFLKVSFI